MPFLPSSSSHSHYVRDATSTMTLRGTVHKTFLLLFLAAVGAFLVQQHFFGLWLGGASVVLREGPSQVYATVVVGLLALGLAIFTRFRPDLAMWTSPVYALLEGGIIGFAAFWGELSFPGVTAQALVSVLAVFLAVLFVYYSGLIVPDGRFRTMVFSFLVGLTLLQIIQVCVRLLGGTTFLGGGGLIGLAARLLTAVVATSVLLLEMDQVVKLAKARAPRYMEWYSAFGLLVSLLWVFVEVFRFLVGRRCRRR